MKPHFRLHCRLGRCGKLVWRLIDEYGWRTVWFEDPAVACAHIRL